MESRDSHRITNWPHRMYTTVPEFTFRRSITKSGWKSPAKMKQINDYLSDVFRHFDTLGINFNT